MVFSARAQENRYMIFFKDKTGTPYYINQPSEFLSQRAIARRAKQNIAIAEEDLPVNPAYINQLKTAGATVLYSSRWFNAALVEVTPSEKITIQTLNFVQSVEYAAPGKNGTGGRQAQNLAAQTTGTTSLANTTQFNMLGLDNMVNDGLTGNGVFIAVLDAGFTGVNNQQPFNHIFANNKLVDHYNFAYGNTNVFGYDDHGTQVLSTIAAESENYSSGATDATFMLYVTEHVPTEFRVEEYLWAFAAERADSVGADIISSSLGYSEFDDAAMDYTYSDLDGGHAAISKAAQFAFERGIVVVNSAGNRYVGSDWSRITPPADGPNVLAVGSVDASQVHAPSSLLGPNALNVIKPDVMGMGAGAVVVNGNGTVTNSNGTSFSCPQVASLVAGVWQMNPALSASQMLDLMRRAGSRYFNPDNTYGYGIPTYQAIKHILEFDPVGQGILLFPNPIQGNTIQIAIAPADGSTVWVRLSTLIGQSVYEQTYQANWHLNPFAVDVATLAPGVYIAQVKSGTKSRTFRVVKP